MIAYYFYVLDMASMIYLSCIRPSLLEIQLQLHHVSLKIVQFVYTAFCPRVHDTLPHVFTLIKHVAMHASAVFPIFDSTIIIYLLHISLYLHTLYSCNFTLYLL